MMFSGKSLKAALSGLVFTALALGASNSVAKDDTFPTGQPVKIIVAFPPGSGSDSSARFLAEELRRRTGHSFIVENRPGGNSFIAARALATAPADGYTISLASDPMMASNTAVFKDLPYDPVKDFDPIAKIVDVPNIIAVSGSSTYQSLDDLVKAGADEELIFGAGSGSYEIVGEGFLRMLGIKGRMVPYGSPIQALTDLARGDLDLVIADIATAGALLQSGRIKALAVTTTERHPHYPDVPTVSELGFPGYSYSSWGGVYGPAGMPKDRIEYLANHIHEIVKSEKGQEFFLTQGIVPDFLDSDSLRAFHIGQVKWWDETAREVGFEPR